MTQGPRQLQSALSCQRICIREATLHDSPSENSMNPPIEVNTESLSMTHSASSILTHQASSFSVCLSTVSRSTCGVTKRSRLWEQRGTIIICTYLFLLSTSRYALSWLCEFSDQASLTDPYVLGRCLSCNRTLFMNHDFLLGFNLRPYQNTAGLNHISETKPGIFQNRLSRTKMSILSEADR